MFFLLKDPTTSLPGIGPKSAQRFSKLNILNINDLIHYYPKRWEDFSQIKPIFKLIDKEKITIKAKLVSLHQFRSFYKKLDIINALFQDASGHLQVTWFNQSYLAKTLKQQKTYLLSGTTKKYKNHLTLTNPVVESLISPALHSSRIVSIYPLTEGITSKLFRKSLVYLIRTIRHIPETLPNQLLKKYQLISLTKAIENIHFPISSKILIQAKKRLSAEELIPIHLSIILNKHLWGKQIGRANKITDNFFLDFTSQLDFKLTVSQKVALKQIVNDLKKPNPMNRLLMGDVGSGKTIVAAGAIIATVKNGFQAVLMAPTEILATQHYASLKPLLNKWDIKTTLLTGSIKLNNWQEIANKKVDVIIGTHALIQKTAKFKDINLIIIDEQHRFGVGQRKALKNKNLDFAPHFLSLSATPIPRTIFLGLLKDLDISWLDSLPQGRLPIMTKLITSKDNILNIKKLINQEINKKHKIFIIAPLIKENARLNSKTSVMTEKAKVAKLLPKARIATLHGKMKSEDKLKIMNQIKNNGADILIATSVIEVGIDIPSATVIWIKNAESFGLAQLHQMRGRVGRSNIQSYCLIESDSNDPTTLGRLEALVKIKNGTELAEIDLKLRGPGVFFSEQQSGFTKLKLTNLTNIKLIQESRQLANDLFKLDPSLKKFSHFKDQIQLNYLTHAE